MRMELKYQIRRLIAAALLVGLLTILTSIVIKKGIDADFERQDRILEEHTRLWSENNNGN